MIDSPNETKAYMELFGLKYIFDMDSINKTLSCRCPKTGLSASIHVDEKRDHHAIINEVTELLRLKIQNKESIDEYKKAYWEGSNKRRVFRRMRRI